MLPSISKITSDILFVFMYMSQKGKINNGALQFLKNEINIFLVS